jgi:hypothetical protein
MQCVPIAKPTSRPRRIIVVYATGASVAWTVSIAFGSDVITEELNSILISVMPHLTDHCPWMNNCVGAGNLSELRLCGSSAFVGPIEFHAISL